MHFSREIINLECLISARHLGTPRVQCRRNDGLAKRIEELQQGVPKSERDLGLLLRGTEVEFSARIQVLSHEDAVIDSANYVSQASDIPLGSVG